MDAISPSQLSVNTLDILGNIDLPRSDSSSSGNHAAVADFESIFYSMMLKTMRNTLTEDGLFGKEASDTYGGMFDLFMSQHLAKSQPLGIGQVLNAYLNVSERAK